MRKVQQTWKQERWSEYCPNWCDLKSQLRTTHAPYRELLASVDGQIEKLPFTVKCIGDCEAPAIIAAATYAGHKYGRELDASVNPDQPLKHDRIDVGADDLNA